MYDRVRADRAYLLAVDLVSFFDVHRDEAIRVAGHYGRPVRRRAQEVKHQAALRVFPNLCLHGKSDGKQLRDEAPLRRFDRAPVPSIIRVVDIWDRTIETTGDAERVRIAPLYEPVT